MMKIFQMNKSDWMVGPSLEACQLVYQGLYADSEIHEPHELTEAELDDLVFTDNVELATDKQVKRTFREQLAVEVAAGGPFPRLFASTEY